MDRKDLHDEHGNIDRKKLTVLAKRLAEERAEQQLDRALALLGWGWLPSLASEKPTPVAAWYWRKPSKGKRQGRLFLSTDQAFTNLMDALE